MRLGTRPPVRWRGQWIGYYPAMSHYVRLLSAVAVLSFACGPAADVGPGPSPLAVAARAFLDDAVAEERVAGAVALVSHGDELAFFGASGMADREAGIPMTTATLFRIASMTKPVTSVAVMMLVEDGKLRLEDPLSSYIPEFAEMSVLVDPAEPAVPSEQVVTLHHLLTHTSGIAYRFLAPDVVAERYAELNVPDGLLPIDGLVGDAMKRLASAPLLHEPGASFTYGLSVDVLGHVVETVSGQSLDAFLEERIFAPLGMTDTFFYVPSEKASRLAAIYGASGEKTLTKFGDEPVIEGHLELSASSHLSGPTSYFSGGGGLVSSVSDYFRFARMLSGGGELDGARLLESDTVERMTRNQIGDLTIGGTTKFGLGFAVIEESSPLGGEGSFGWDGYYNTRFWVDPANDIVGIYMAQLAPFEDRDGFRLAIYEALRQE